MIKVKHPDIVSEKEKNNKRWWLPAMDYWITTAINSRNINIVELLNVANGDISKSNSLDYLTKSIIYDKDGYSEAEFESKIPLREIDLITYVREKYQSEYMLLPYNVRAIGNNPDAVIEINHKVGREVRKVIEKIVINMLNEAKVDTNFDNFDISSIKSAIEDAKEEFFDEIVLRNTHKLKALNQLSDWDTLRHIGFFNWFATEHYYDYRFVENGKFNKEVINVADGYPVLNHKNTVADGDAFLYKRRISISEAVSKYKDKLTKDEFDYMQYIIANKASTLSIEPNSILFNRLSDIYGSNNVSTAMSTVSKSIITGEGFIEENIIQFKVPRKIKVLTYKVLGDVEEYTKEVDSSYKLNPDNGDISIKTIHTIETYTGTRLGPMSSGIYIKPTKDKIQRIHNGNLKLHFTGGVGLMPGLNINPIPMRLATSQTLLKIVLYNIEKAMSKLKGSILTIPKSSLMTNKKTIKGQYFYMREGGVYIYDDGELTPDDISKAFRIVGDDVGANLLTTLINIKNEIKEEAFEFVNMNSQRRGEQSPYVGKGVMEQSIFRSKISSALMIQTLHRIFADSHQADLDISKELWIDNDDVEYFDSDNEAYKKFTVDSIEHSNTDYLVFVNNSAAEQEYVDAFKSLILPAAQSGEYKIASEAIRINSPVEGKKLIGKLDDEIKQRQQSAAKAEQESNKEIATIEANNDQANRDSEYAIAQLKEEAETNRTILKINQAILDSADSGVYTDAEIKQTKNNIDRMTLELKRDELAHKKANDAAKISLQKDKLKNDKFIAKVNKN